MHPTSPIHLLVCVHGMWGAPAHLEPLVDVVRDAHPPDSTLDILVAKTNQTIHTYDGVDWGADRLVDEIHEHIKQLESSSKRVIRFSIIGYSLGGLVARYVIGVLHASKFFDTIVPVNFATIATPHFGLPIYPGFRSAMFAKLGPRLLSRTGEQFYGRDQWRTTGKPLLEIMSEPSSIFFRALCLFKNITIYANTINDPTVPYVTAAIELHDPFLSREVSGLEVTFNPMYHPIIDSYTIPPLPPSRTRVWRPPKLPTIPVRFPLNVLIYAALPIALPFIIVFALTRLSLDSRASRTRIKLLEASFMSSDSQHSGLRALLDELEMIQGADSHSPQNQDSCDKEAALPVAVTVDTETTSTPDATSVQPVLSPSQQRMVRNLNTIPRLTKKLVFIDSVTHTHGVIIARELKQFPETSKIGLGVLRNVADSFEV